MGLKLRERAGAIRPMLQLKASFICEADLADVILHGLELTECKPFDSLSDFDVFNFCWLLPGEG